MHESAVGVVLNERWGLTGELRPLTPGGASHTWQSGRYVVKLARDEPAHFAAGLRASELIERSGIVTGAPVRDTAGELCAPLAIAGQSWVLAVLRKVAGQPLSIHAVAPPVLGELLARLHSELRGCPPAGAWTPRDVLGHMRRGSTGAQPASIRELVTRAISDVRAYYRSGPPVQLLYGDGPGMFSVNGTDVSSIIDWGGVRAGSIADDIGCWTAHGATDRIPLDEYTAAFLGGYRRRCKLTAADAAAVPLFQRLRIVSRACYVTDPETLSAVETWLRRAFPPG